MKLPVLYAKSSTNKFKVWSVEAFCDHYKVTHGFENCKMQTQSRPVEAKNIGKKNETTKQEQAILEAQRKWQLQIDKKGYRENKEDCGTNDYHHPMKAGYYDKQKHRIVFPCYVSPKLNGINVTTPERDMHSDDVRYQSSGGKYYDTLSHLDIEIKNLFFDEIPICGEIYIHGVDLQDISSAVKKHNDLTPSLEYWIYDVVESGNTYEEDLVFMREVLEDNIGKVKLCPVEVAFSHEDIKRINKKWVDLGYEGTIVRNMEGVHKPGPNRSPDCLKNKDFIDAEFEIIDYEGDVHNRVLWVCKTESGGVFTVMPKGGHKKREKWYKNGDKFIGKMLTVRFLEYSKDKIPQGNPVGHGNPKELVGECIRDYE